MCKEKTAIIVGAGDFTDRGLDAPYDLVIAADAGLKNLLDNNILPDVIIGDYDSLGHIPEGEEVIILPVEKDMTDLDASMRLAWERGCRRFLLYGATGGLRIDHFLGNLQLAAEFSRLGAKVSMIAPDFTIHMLTNGTLSTMGTPGAYFSVLSCDPVSEAVSISGDAKYKLTDETLPNTGTLGISNELLGNNLVVSVRRGTLMILLYNQKAVD